MLLWSLDFKVIWNEHDLVIAYGRAEGEPEDKDNYLAEENNCHPDSGKKR